MASLGLCLGSAHWAQMLSLGNRDSLAQERQKSKLAQSHQLWQSCCGAQKIVRLPRWRCKKETFGRDVSGIKPDQKLGHLALV